jgi:hypothetical protein
LNVSHPVVQLCSLTFGESDPQRQLQWARGSVKATSGGMGAYSGSVHLNPILGKFVKAFFFILFFLFFPADS